MAWFKEFGCAEDCEGRINEDLFNTYPAVLLAASEDDRPVRPQHSLKLICELQGMAKKFVAGDNKVSLKPHLLTFSKREDVRLASWQAHKYNRDAEIFSFLAVNSGCVFKS